MNKKVIMSVDAGGTKTKVALIDYEKNIVFEKVGESGSPAVLKEKAIENIVNLVKEAISENNGLYDISYIQMGISGLGVVKDKVSYEKKLAEELNIPVSMENDAIEALYSTVTDLYEEGIVILAGTGSAVCGINKSDEVMLNGGWGHLLTEDGSSYSAVRTLVVKMIKQYEEGEEICPLGQKLMALLNVVNLPDIRNFIYYQTKNEIASYSKLISAEADKGDCDAIEILKEAGKELANRVITLSKRLGISVIDGKSVLGFRGGFVSNIPLVREEIMKTLKQNGYNFSLADSKIDPVYGGFYLAKRKRVF